MKKTSKSEAGSKWSRWNFKILLGEESEASLIKSREKAEKESYQFINKWKERTDWLEDAKVLKEALAEYENWAKFYGANSTEEYYYGLRYAQNQNDPKIKAKLNKSADLANKIQNDILFFTLKLSKISDQKQKEFLNNSLLTDYHHFLEELFKGAKHTLTEQEEKILTLKQESSYNSWVKMTEGFLSKEEREIKIKGKKVKVNYEQLLTLMSHEDKKIRDQAGQAFNDIVAKYTDVAEAELNAILHNKKINDELRHYERPDSGRHLSDDINSAVVDALLEAVSGQFKIAERFYKLKAKLLGQKKLAYHERNVPIGKIDKELTYPKAISLVQKVLTQLDPEFGEIYKYFNQNGQFDVFPATSKQGGAFCASGLLSHPTYINLNYTNRLNDALTIAHEVGHGINNELQRQTQNALNFGTPLATAEVASTFMEDFVLEEILQTENSDQAKLSIAMVKLNSDISTIFRQIACYRFEQELHKTFREKGYLSKIEIGKIFQKHMKSYMGNAVEQSAGAENWWVYWGHIRNFFYVYSYASGLLISKAMQNKVKQDPTFIKKVKEFLASGCSASPKDIFAKMDIDISDKKFWINGLKEIEQQLKEVELLAKKLNYKV